jgi:hypothetical protein
MATEHNPLIAARHAQYTEIAKALEAVGQDLAAAGIDPLHTETYAAELRQRVADRQAVLETIGRR